MEARGAACQVTVKRRAVGRAARPFVRPGAYNGRDRGDIQTLAVLAETPVPARFSRGPSVLTGAV